MKRLKGTLTALITPFTSAGKIDWPRLWLNLEFQLSCGIDGVVPVGTTGESPTLDWEEHLRLILKVKNTVGNHAFVLAGTGSNNTKEAIHASVAAVEDGANGVLLVEPYYNKPASPQIRDFYHRPIAEAVYQVDQNVVVVPYIIPGRTCCKLEPFDLALLAQQCPNVSAVKEATGDLDNMALTRELLGQDFSILSGDDGLTAQMMRQKNIRADSVISVMSNIIPQAISDMVKAFAADDNVTGTRLSSKLKPLFDLVTVKAKIPVNLGSQHFEYEVKYPNPGAIKTMMAGLDLDTGFLRPPLGKMNLAAVQKVRGALLEVWQNSPEILRPLANFYGIDIEARLFDADGWGILAA